MQLKRYQDKVKIALIAAAGLALAGLVVLMTIQVPAPHRSIEKTLDAKAFLAPQLAPAAPPPQPAKP